MVEARRRQGHTSNGNIGNLAKLPRSVKGWGSFHHDYTRDNEIMTAIDLKSNGFSLLVEFWVPRPSSAQSTLQG